MHIRYILALPRVLSKKNKITNIMKSFLSVQREQNAYRAIKPLALRPFSSLAKPFHFNEVGLPWSQEERVWVYEMNQPASLRCPGRQQRGKDPRCLGSTGDRIWREEHLQLLLCQSLDKTQTPAAASPDGDDVLVKHLHFQQDVSN